MRRILLPALLAGLLAAPAAEAATVTSSATMFHDPGGKGFPETWITSRTIHVVAVPARAIA